MGKMWPFDYEDRVVTILRIFQLGTVIGALIVMAFALPHIF